MILIFTIKFVNLRKWKIQITKFVTRVKNDSSIKQFINIIVSKRDQIFLEKLR